MTTFVDTMKPEGRPDTVLRPSYWGGSLNPALSVPADPAVQVASGKREIRLPPGMNKAQFERAMDDLRGLIGAENVELNDVPLNDGSYYHVAKSHDSYAVMERDYFVASAVCYPGSTAEVQAVVRWANQWLIPLWPISIGRNLGYGGAAPRVPGSIVVDLGKRMNKVLEVNERGGSCVVEPGVTYIDLYEELQRRKSSLMIDVPDLGGGSVLGNACQRGVGYTPMGDHFGNHCGMEIVLANGELMRTGTDAMPGSKTGQLYPYAFGPSPDGLFSQSNFGIITRMGMWLMPKPEGIRVFQIIFKRYTDLAPAVEIIRPLMLNRVFGNVPSLRCGLWDAAAHQLSKDRIWPDHQGRPVPEDVENRLYEELGTGAWIFYSCLYGPDEMTLPTYEMIKEKFSVIPDVKFVTREEAAPNAYLHDRACVFSGVPTFRELDYLNWKGKNTGELWFAPISPVDGQDAVKQVEMCKKRCHEYGFDYLGTYYVAAREAHHIVGILFDRTNPEECRRAALLNSKLISDAAELGYGEYRTHLAFHDQVASTFNWNDGALMKFHETLKDATDPNGILAPGASGLWPKKYREQGGWQIDVTKPPKDTRHETVERI